ncbi:MAG: type II toxin-antitoxin system HicA family toxin [Patescibacteria group bacterium]|jgi:predicted RNA binding protein YcfA (HicA-like mRNA interferase family)
MSKLPSLKPKKVLQALLRAGFVIHHQKGSHVQLRHSSKSALRVTIPFHTKFDLPGDVVASIMVQAGLSREEFIKLL